MAALSPDSVLVEQDFARGIVRDRPRGLIPPGGVYDAKDLMLEQPGKAYKRGGSSYVGSSLGSTTGPAYWVSAADTSGTGGGPGRVLGIGPDLNLYDVTTAAVLIGSVGFGPGGNPCSMPTPGVTFGSTQILCDAAASTAPKKVTHNATVFALASLGGTPPTASLCCAHLSYLVLACSTTHPNRLWFSPVPDFETAWDTTNAWVDVNERIMGLASLGGVLLVFTRNHVMRLIGNVPPGTTGENMELQPLGTVGCIDPKSVVTTDGEVIWASFDGVFMTNGAGIVNLTAKPDGDGIQSYWRSLHSTTAYGGVPAGMLGRDMYIVNVLGAGDVDSFRTAAATLVCHLPTRAWWRIGNLSATGFATGQSEVLTSRTYAALAGARRIVDLTDFVNPASGNKNDADGVAVTPLLETRALGAGTWLKAYGHGHLTYDMRDAASDNPTLAVTAATGEEADSGFVAVAESPLAETTASTRSRFAVNKDSQAVSLRFTQSNASSKTELYGLELEERPYPPGGDGQ